MNILLVNPPNCGRSIPEERYGITSIKQIFRGEPLALEELAGNLHGHEIRLIDLKADPGGLARELQEFRPDVAGITGVTCEANTVLRLAQEIRGYGAVVVVGGIHASNDPEFFNREEIDYIVTGLGKRTFAQLVDLLEEGGSVLPSGVCRTSPGRPLDLERRCSSPADMVQEQSPDYQLVSRYREHYVLERLGIRMGFVASAFGCPHSCSFCAIRGQTGGSYLTRSAEAVIRDISLLPQTPVIRLVDANTFGDVRRARELADALLRSGLAKQYLADIRSDTVVRHPELLRLWKQAGLRAVIIGFEAIDDASLASMQKASEARMNTEAIAILHDLGITIVGDFIISPDAEQEDFSRLSRYFSDNPIDLPMITVMTPLPGTPLYSRQQHLITNHDLDYYTLTNAVIPTRLDEERFYTAYAELLSQGHNHARI
ncbi:MAG: cobalamin-dependent protein [Desulfocapsaceae bacterium]|nr:cobalamin-dependent protein [Desulfocapsaceae bacterium]